MRDNSAHFRDIFLHDVPMMDVRAPVEFTKGAFPGVINLPLMNDIERQNVGTAYKQEGQQAAHRSLDRLHPPAPRRLSVLLSRRLALADHAAVAKG
jgi:tRNA 2-selenouridine synthase SelU